ncbi:ATP-binding protein [Streptomyces sp. NBC_01198]|uniref:ATP-binding protein n=1 Tax=Streptomyces sp. NBC_01198 TaxID=2903769 RepID=UPI002E15CC9D|nr:ATP-binding protein [Streptomyces sp. NBC_01198]
MSDAPGEVARARRWAQGQVEEFAWPTRWRPDGAAVALLVSELVTNALRYAGGLVGLSLVFDARRLRIVVSDDSTALPVLRPHSAGGRGLVIVDRLTRSWGVVSYRTGKQVWADLAAAGAAPAQAPAGHRPPGAPGRPQECLNCAALISGSESWVRLTFRRRWTPLVGAVRRMLPPWRRSGICHQ